jgi:hypothetical protein
MSTSIPDYLEADDECPREWTAMSWLGRLDEATLDKVRYLSSIFFEEHDDVPPECIEYLCLCYSVAKEETGRSPEDLTDEEREDSLIGVSLFANFESLRRKGLLEVQGTGKVTEFRYNTTSVFNTDTGEMYRSAVQTMKDLSDAVQQ